MFSSLSLKEDAKLLLRASHSIYINNINIYNLLLMFKLIYVLNYINY